MSLTGACLCGGVRFELTEPPLGAGYCHCTRCQRRTGTAASMSARVAAGSVRILVGDELVRSFTPPDGAPKDFCSACGSALWSRDRERGHIAGVRVGALDPGHGIEPSYRQFVAYAASWEPLPDDGLPRYPERRPPGVG